MATGLFPRKQVRGNGMASHPINLGNDTESGISSTGHATQMKLQGIKRQPLTSTRKTKSKLLVTAQQHWSELAAMRQGAPHGAHIRPLQQGVNQTQPYRSLYSWKSATNPGKSRDSSFVSIEEHTQLTTATLMQRDAPCQSIFDEEDYVISIHEDGQSNVEMVSAIRQPKQHTKDSLADCTAGDSDHNSNDSDMESDQDRSSSHHSNSGSDHGWNPGSDSESGSDGSSGSGLNSSDDKGGNFADMFKGQQKCPGSVKKPGHWKHAEVPKKPHGQLPSSSWSRSRERENQKRRHVASLENMPNPDKADRKKKKSDRKETPSKSHPRGDSWDESTQDQVARRLGEEVVQKYQAEEEERERQSRPKKSKKGSSNQKETLTTWDSSDEDDHERRRRKKEKEREKKAKAREAKLQAKKEKQEREAEDRCLCQEKLLDQYRRKKYNLECLKLRAYRQKHISPTQMESVWMTIPSIWTRSAEINPGILTETSCLANIFSSG